MLFGNDRRQLRQMYFDAWGKYRRGEPITPLEAQIVEVVALHPEYHALFDQPDRYLDRDYLPEFGETNPFLHLGLHLGIREQVSINRPAGIAAVHGDLKSRMDPHDAEHAMIEALAESLWEAQRAGLPPDEAAYLGRLQRLVQAAG
jgi:hypothetical protein